MVTDSHDHPGVVKGGQWPDWLSAKEAEVYSLQVHHHKIKEKTWRRQTHKEPSPVKWQDENTPTGTRYVFYRPDVDSYVLDRKKEAEDSIARSKMVKDGQDRTETDMTGHVRSKMVKDGQDHSDDVEKDEKINELEKEVSNLRIDNRAKEQVINQMADDRKELFSRVADMGREIGVLENKLLQLEAPSHVGDQGDRDNWAASKRT